jgi:hypothetical protein
MAGDEFAHLAEIRAGHVVRSFAHALFLARRAGLGNIRRVTAHPKQVAGHLLEAEAGSSYFCRV